MLRVVMQGSPDMLCVVMQGGPDMLRVAKQGNPDMLRVAKQGSPDMLCVAKQGSPDMLQNEIASTSQTVQYKSIGWWMRRFRRVAAVITLVARLH
jgi:hypothetical protein